MYVYIYITFFDGVWNTYRKITWMGYHWCLAYHPTVPTAKTAVAGSLWRQEWRCNLPGWFGKLSPLLRLVHLIRGGITTRAYIMLHVYNVYLHIHIFSNAWNMLVPFSLGGWTLQNTGFLIFKSKQGSCGFQVYRGIMSKTIFKKCFFDPN